MSLRRRVAHRLKVAAQKTYRRRSRRTHECRVRHWRTMIEAMVIEGWTRPIDQNARVAYAIVRCREHRTNLAVASVINYDEEVSALSVEALALDRMNEAVRTLKRELVPFDFRRAFA